jgi:hypothetical protein
VACSEGRANRSTPDPALRTPPEPARIPRRRTAYAAIPSWTAGDTLAGSSLRQFRILDVNTDDVPDGLSGVFSVETVDEYRAEAN